MTENLLENNRVLLETLVEAVANARIPNCRALSDIMLDDDTVRVREIFGQVLAVMDRRIAPFKPGTIVKPKQLPVELAKENDWTAKNITEKGIKIVHRIFYEGGGKWLITLKGLSGEYDADAFAGVTIAELTQNPTPTAV